MNNQLTIDELRAYQAGQLDGPARHRVERLLLEDPFYADALEGLEALQRTGASLPKQSAQLRRALQERINESATQRRLFPLWVTTMAASIVLVMGIGLYFIFTTNPTKAPLANPQPKAAHSDAIVVEIGPTDSAITKTVDAVAVLEAQTARQRGLIENSRPVRPQSVRTQTEDAATKVLKINANQTEATKELFAIQFGEPQPASHQPVNPERAFASSPTGDPDITLWSDNHSQLTLAQSSQLIKAYAESRPAPGAFTVPSLGKLSEKKVFGTVTDPKGEPLPGVQIMVKGINQGTMTNATGQFSLDSALVAGRTLRMAYVGFKAQELTPLALKNGPITLFEDTQALNEVVVTGYGATKAGKANMYVYVTELNETEVQSFREYVKKEAASYFQGPLSVRIYTEADGSVRKVSVENGIRIQEPGQKRTARSYIPSTEVRAEAERLARQYPGWPKKRQTLLWITGWPVENRN